MKPIRPIHFEGNKNHAAVLDQVDTILRGNVSFGDGTHHDNIDGQWATVNNTGAADTEFTVPITLNRIPVGFDVKTKSKAGDVYLGTTAWTKKNIYLKCSGANVKLLLFIH